MCASDSLGYVDLFAIFPNKWIIVREFTRPFFQLAYSEIHGFGSIDLKSLQAENLCNVLPPTSRSSNYIALEYCDFPSDITVRLLKNYPSNPFYWLLELHSTII